MPDLVLAGADGEYTQQIWPHEVCASCKRAGECPLLQLLREYEVLTYMGMTVFRCKQYDPDEDSQFFIAREIREPDRIIAEQLMEAQNGTDQLIAELMKARGKIWSPLNLSDTPGQDQRTRPWPMRLGKST